MSEYNVKVQDKDYTVSTPRAFKAMWLTDYVTEILEQVPGIFQEVEDFKTDYKLKHRELITEEDFDSKKYEAVVELLGIEKKDFSDDKKLVTDENGVEGLPFYHDPPDLETIAFIFPKVWKVARKDLIDLCALIITKDGELEKHDEKGAMEALLEKRAHWLKFNADIPELLEIVSIGVVIVKEQLESASKSVGKVAENLTGILTGEEATGEPTEVEKEEPDEELSAAPL